MLVVVTKQISFVQYFGTEAGDSNESLACSSGNEFGSEVVALPAWTKLFTHLTHRAISAAS